MTITDLLIPSPPAFETGRSKSALDAGSASSGADSTDLLARYAGVRGQTEALGAPLELEDDVVSSMAEVSPTKLHLAHTSWFFGTFVLAEHDAAYRSPDPRYTRFVEAERLHTGRGVGGGIALEQLHGDVRQWTQSAHVGYPNYRPSAGAIGEYNGKWMADQWVLRGASSATSRSHERVTYRNFFPSDARWQFTGIRLADGGAGAGSRP